MKPVDKQAFAKRLSGRLAKLGINPSQLAKALGVPQQTIDGYVHGRVAKSGIINEIAEALCTTAKWLQRGEGPEEVIAPFSSEEILGIVKGLKPELRGAAVRFLKTLTEKNDEAA